MSKLETIVLEYSNRLLYLDSSEDNPTLGELVDTPVNAIKELLLEIVGEDKEQHPRMFLEGTDGEGHDRFYRNGGYNFAKQEIRNKIKEL